MAFLTQVWDDARHGHGGVVLLAGDAGIGKTRLAEELEAIAESDGGLVAWGRCHDAEGLPAYWPWIQMLRDLVERSPDDELRHDMSTGAAEVSAVIPELRQRVPGAQVDEPARGQGDRESFFQAVADYLSWSSRRHPLLLILDDLHVADPSSLVMLRALAPQITSASVLLVATYRGTESGAGDHLRETVAALDRGRAYRLHVEGLSPDEVRAVMDARSGLSVPAPLARAVHEQTTGNPLFVVELTRLLAVEGHLVDPSSCEGGRLPLPQGVLDVLDRQIARLSTACRELLAVAALLGRSIDLLVLSGASGLSGDALLDLLDEAIDARILQPDGGSSRYRFVHPLVREVLIVRSSEGERLRLHARIAQTLERHYPADPDALLPDLAYHFSRAAPLGYGPQAFDYSYRAGTGALARFGYEEAAEHFTRALTLLPCSGLEAHDQRTQAVELHEQVGDALSLAARRAEAVRSYQRASALLTAHDRVERARLERKSGTAWLADQEPTRALTHLDSADDALRPAGDSGTGATTESSGGPDAAWVFEKIEITLQRLAALYFIGDHEGLALRLAEARPLLETWGTETQRSIFANHYLALALRQERYYVSPDTLAYARDNRGRLQRSGVRSLVCEADYQLGFALLWAGGFDDAEVHLRECARSAEAERDHSHLVRALTYLSVLERLRGRVEEARAAAERTCEQATLAHLPGYFAAGTATLAWAARRDGDLTSAETQAREALQLWRVPSAFPFEWLARWPLVATLLAADDRAGQRRDDRLAEAREHVALMLEHRQQRLPTELTALMMAATGAGVGDTATGATLSEALQAAARGAEALNYC